MVKGEGDERTLRSKNKMLFQVLYALEVQKDAARIRTATSRSN